MLFKCIILMAAIFANSVQAKTFKAYSLPNSEVNTLKSDINDVDYKLYISLPKDYKNTLKSYPVIYTLDADYSFAIVKNILEHMSDRGDLPKAIVVGIAYNEKVTTSENYKLNRTRDYTPWKSTPNEHYSTDTYKVAGHANQFIKVIENEIMPYVANNYRSNLYDQTIIGHSFGGLFATYTLLTHSDLFQRYIILSPSLWYDDGKIFDIEADKGNSSKGIQASVFMGIGSEENKGFKMVDQLQMLYRHLNTKDYKDLSLSEKVFDDETHNSVFPVAVSRGLREVFQQNTPSKK